MEKGADRAIDPAIEVGSQEKIAFRIGSQSQEEQNNSRTKVPVEDRATDLDQVRVQALKAKVGTEPYFELAQDQLRENYRLFHFILSKQDKRTLLVNIGHSVDDIILKICATFGIPNPEQYFLWLPKGVEGIYSGKKRSTFAKLMGKGASKTVSSRLDGGKPLHEQFDFSVKPYLLHMSRCAPGEAVDSGEGGEGGEDVTGEEWPDFEDPEIAKKREFHQCWLGVIQGDYPVEQSTAVQIAALLNLVFGTEIEVKDGYTVNRAVDRFLPPAYQNNPDISKEIVQAQIEHSGKSRSQAMAEVVSICRNRVSYEGVFFDVQEHVSQFPLKKKKHRLLGVNYQGVISVHPRTGKVLFIHRFSDIHDGSASDDIIHLNFQHWGPDYYAYSDQAREIMEVLQLYISQAKAVTKRVTNSRHN